MADGLKDWSELGEDLLCMIGQRLMALEDVIRSRAVCNSWSRALLAEENRRFPPFTHLLMLPYCTSSNMNMDMTMFSTITSCSRTAATPMIGCKGSESCRCFYDVALHKFHHFEFPQGLHNRSCRGSSMGWLCMVGETPASISLLNPLTRTEIPLPPITSFPDVLGYNPGKARVEYLIRYDEYSPTRIGKKFMESRFMSRVALSAEPTTGEEEDCIVMGIRWLYNNNYRLAFCRPAEVEAGWKYVSHEENGVGGVTFVDVVFWRDRFYAMDIVGRVLVCDFSSADLPTLSFVLDFPGSCCVYNEADVRYLVVCPAAVTGDDDDQLMMVARNSQLVIDDEHDYNYDQQSDDEDSEYNISDSDSEDDQPGNGGGGEAATTKLYWTDAFKVFKMNKDASGGWDEVESIGDFALFLGCNSSSTFVPTNVHPRLMPNSIYFTDDLMNPHPKRRHAGHDMGVYNLATRTIQPLYSTTSLHNNPLKISPVPVWFSPSQARSRLCK